MVLAVVCLMIASKIQTKDSHLVVTEARKLLIKLSKTQSSLTDPRFNLEMRDMRQIACRRLAQIERNVVACFNFSVNLPTPVEFIVVYLQVLETKVSKMDSSTIQLLRGQSVSNSYICLHLSECSAMGPETIAVASLMQVMESWQWTEVTSRFIDLTATSDDYEDDQLFEEEVRICQSLLQGVIDEQKATQSPRTETAFEESQDQLDENSEEEGEVAEFPDDEGRQAIVSHGGSQHVGSACQDDGSECSQGLGKTSEFSKSPRPWNQT